jgi:hypothetical protein
VNVDNRSLFDSICMSWRGRNTPFSYFAGIVIAFTSGFLSIRNESNCHTLIVPPTWPPWNCRLDIMPPCGERPDRCGSPVCVAMEVQHTAKDEPGNSITLNYVFLPMAKAIQVDWIAERKYWFLEKMKE